MKRAGLRWRFVYSFFQCLVRIFFAFRYNGVTVRGRENIPQKGPVIIFYNHQDVFDPPILGSFLSRPFYFVAKEELFTGRSLKARIFSWIIARFRGLPINRENPLKSRESFQFMKKLLEQGEGIAIAPEGTRNLFFSETRRLLPLKKGFLKLILHQQARRTEDENPNGLTVLPAGINYIPRPGKGAKVFVSFGKPVDISPYIKLFRNKQRKAAVEKFSEVISAAIMENVFDT